MSKSFIPKDNLVHGAIGEIIAAKSSLHMPPDPIPISETLGSNGYISETDYNVQHAIEHLSAAIDILSAIGSIDNDVSNFLSWIEEDGEVTSISLRLLEKYRNVKVKKMRQYDVISDINNFASS